MIFLSIRLNRAICWGVGNLGGGSAEESDINGFPGTDRRAQRVCPAVLAYGGYAGSARGGGCPNMVWDLLPAPWGQAHQTASRGASGGKGGAVSGFCPSKDRALPIVDLVCAGLFL